MKNIVLVLVSLLVSITSYGQFEENKWQVDGSFSYSSGSDALIITPGLGRSIKSDQVIGIRPGIITDFDETDFRIGTWFDKYKTLKSDLPLFLVLRWSLDYTDISGSVLSAGFSPGFAFQPTDHWLLTARFLAGNIGYIFDGDDVFLSFGTSGGLSFAYTF